MKTTVVFGSLILCRMLWVLPLLMAGQGEGDLPRNLSGFEERVSSQDDPLGVEGGWVMVRIHVAGPTAPQVTTALSRGFHLATEEPPARGFFDLVVPRKRLPELRGMGWKFVVRKEMVPPRPVVSDGVNPPEILIPPQYHTYEEMTQELDSLYRANPAIAYMESLGVSTLNHRIMWGFKVSDNVGMNEDEPAVLYVSTHHGCEMIGMEYCLYLIRYLLTHYGTDPQTTEWVDDTEIWFVPLFNPDGYWAVYTDLNHEWRKNARDTNENGIYYEYADTFWTAPHDGVDLNRNYSFNWTLGGSTDPMSPWYRGDSPFSEDENRSMLELATREKFQMAITFHSWGEVVIYPWDIDWNSSFSPDHPVISAIADTVAERIPTEDRIGTYYAYPGSAKQPYIDNWIYGELGTICMTLEVNPWPIFIEPGDSIIPICERIFSGTTYLLDRVHKAGVTGVVTDSATGLPLLAEVKVLRYYADYVTPRMTDENGRYYRYLLPGETHTLEFIAPGYDTVLVDGVSVHPESLTTVDVAMNPTVGIGEREGPGSASIPTTLWLGQNHPNPFNPATTISFDIPGAVGEGQPARLEIYDVRGRRVRTLLESKVVPGRYQVTWNGRDDRGGEVPSGIYLYTLRVGKGGFVRKMTILK